jgi:hypothetical protein
VSTIACTIACSSDGNAGCSNGQICVSLSGTEGSSASGFCCPAGTACLAEGALCLGNAGRSRGAADVCRAGVCSYDVGPAQPSDGGAAPDAAPDSADASGDAYPLHFDAAPSCPPPQVGPGGGEPSFCIRDSECTDPEQNGQYNPCYQETHCDQTLDLCIVSDPVPDGTSCDDSFERLEGPAPQNPACTGPCTSAMPPPPPPAACSCDTDCPARHRCVLGRCVCNDGFGIACNDVCRGGVCVSDVNTCGPISE